MNANMATETVPNELLNNYNMTTGWDHCTRSNMATERTESPTKWHQERQPVYNYHDMSTERSQRRISLPKDFTWRSN
jgi:hypothetical protein